MMAEAQAIAAKLNITFRHTIEQRVEGAEKVGEHKTSMLQDFEAGRPLETAALIGSILEMGRMTDTPTPLIEAVHALLKLLESTVQASGARSSDRNRPPRLPRRTVVSQRPLLPGLMRASMLRTRKETASALNVTKAAPAAERSAMPRGRKRVALVISHIGPGGAQRVVTNAVKILAERGLDPHLIVFTERADAYPIDPRVTTYVWLRRRNDGGSLGLDGAMRTTFLSRHVLHKPCRGSRDPYARWCRAR